MTSMNLTNTTFANIDADQIKRAQGFLTNAKSIVVLTGAGVSVNAGIPDFRSSGGLFETIKQKYQLKDPTQLFSINYFRENPSIFYEFYREFQLKVSNAVPTPTHHWIKKP